MTHKVSDSELLKNLKTQQSFLKSDIANYEDGQVHFALKIATTLRTIFHSSSTSIPILPLLAKRYDIPVLFKGKGFQPDTFDVLYVGFTIGMKKPLLNSPSLRTMEFNNYWNEIVYLEKPAQYTRKQLVLWAANKLGGAHVDPEIPKSLFHLVNGSVQLISKKYGEETIINQVVYEMGLQTLVLLECIVPDLEIKIK